MFLLKFKNIKNLLILDIIVCQVSLNKMRGYKLCSLKMKLSTLEFKKK